MRHREPHLEQGGGQRCQLAPELENAGSALDVTANAYRCQVLRPEICKGLDPAFPAVMPSDVASGAAARVPGDALRCWHWIQCRYLECSRRVCDC